MYLVITINAYPGKLYHLGFGKSVSKTNLAKANELRSYLIYEEFATLYRSWEQPYWIKHP